MTRDLTRGLRPGREPSASEVRASYNERHGGGILRDRDRFYRLIARRLLACIASGRAGSALVLDAGCGGGYLLRELLRLGSGAVAAAHGLEISDVALAEARRQAPAARLVLGQGEKLPYADRAFDATACLGNLEHFIDPALGARELARVTREDGAVWVLLPNGFYSGDIWRVVRTGYGPDHHQILDRFASVNEWRDFLEANDLAVEEVAPYNRFKWWKRLLPRNLAHHFLYRARPRDRSR